jgi:hypothetical protein
MARPSAWATVSPLGWLAFVVAGAAVGPALAAL